MKCQSEVGASLCDAEGGRSHRSQDIYVVFSQKWREYQEQLYRCCLKWMEGDHAHAEEALSRAAIKAWDKVKDGKYIVINFKAWLTAFSLRQSDRFFVGSAIAEMLALVRSPDLVGCVNEM
jgi:hypothetical protein